MGVNLGNGDALWRPVGHHGIPQRGATIPTWKPRIKRSLVWGGWVCSGGGYHAGGATPMHAYKEWVGGIYGFNPWGSQ